MPKDPSRNVDRYKVRGGHLNEYDFEKGKSADKKQTATDKTQMGTNKKPKKATPPKAAKKSS